MRWLFAILMLMNGVALYWFSSQQPASTPQPASLNEASGLILLSEREPGDLQLSGECLVVGPVRELELIESLSGGLSDLGVAHQRWSLAPSGLAEEQEYWLQFAASLQAKVGRRLWFDILSKSPSTEILQKNCAVVASHGDFP
ncbi:hypothetical protein KFE80_10690 [bacterium SCSIO 12696]|nr:hypothetical protein KFE80_10690 [bacterium SCSIO 12696]